MNTYTKIRAIKLDKHKKIIILGMLFTFLLGIQLTQNAVNTGEVQKQITQPKISDYHDRNELIVPYDFEINSDFHMDYYSWNYWYQMFEGLYTNNLTDPNNEVIPALAKNASWSADNLNFTVNLNENITFHDGTILNATHVKWNFDRIAYLMNETGERTEEQGITSLNSLFRHDNGTPIISQTKVLEEYKVRFVLNQPYAAFKSLLTCGGCLIMKPHDNLWEGNFDNPSLYKGTGPFQLDLEQSDPENGLLVLSTFENYRLGRAKLDSVVFQPVENMEEANQKLLSGEVNYVSKVHNNYKEDIEDNPYIDISEPIIESTYYYLIMNNKLVEKHWRQAISYSLNYSYIIEEVFEKLWDGTRCKSPVPKNFLYSNWSLDVPTLNLSRARQILQDQGIATNFDPNDATEWINAAEGSEPLITLRYSYTLGSEFQEDLLYAVQHNLKYIGIKVEEHGTDFGNWWSMLGDPSRRDEFDLSYLGWGADFNDPSNMLKIFHSQYPDNSAQVNNSQLDALLEAGLNTTDDNERHIIYNDVQELLIEEIMPKVWLFSPNKIIAYHKDFIGFQPNTLNKWWFYPVERIIPTEKLEGTIYIDGSNPDHNWTVAKTRYNTFITGSGTEVDPYVIKADLTSIGRFSCIYIRNSDVYFSIENSTCNNAIEGSAAGIKLKNVSNGKLYNNDIRFNGYGISLVNCKNINVSENLITNNEKIGIKTENVNESYIEKNTIFGNEYFTNVFIEQDDFGIKMTYSHNNTISSNYIANALEGGTILSASYDNKFSDNEFVSSGLYFNFPLEGTKSDLITNSIDSTNTVNGKTLYFYNSTTGLNSTDFSDAGQVILLNVNDSVVSDLDIIDTSLGVSLYYCNNVNLSDSIISDGYIGMVLINSSNCQVSNNRMKDNDLIHTIIDSSSDSLLYLNNFTSASTENPNVIQFPGCSGISWNSSSVGNYYSNYQGVDLNDDGIGDTPQEIMVYDPINNQGESPNHDYYPIWDDGIDLFKNPHVFRVGVSEGPQAPRDLDPLAVTGESIKFMDQVIEPLISYNLSHPQLDLIPRLAKDLGTWSSDGLNYTIELKTGVKFHDGIKFNATVVKWNFERLAYFMNITGNLTEEVTWTDYLYRFNDNTPIIDHIELLGEYKVKFVLNRPFVPFEKLLTFPSSAMLSPDSTDKYHYRNSFDQPLVGTGPFIYDPSLRNSGWLSSSRIGVVANKEYYQGSPNIDMLVFDIIPDASTRDDLMDQGIIDYVLDPGRDFSGNDDVSHEGPINGSTIYYLVQNCDSDQLRNKTYRQAISYAINYTYIAKNLFSDYTVSKSPLPPYVPFANWSLNAPSLNYTKARQILQNKGIAPTLNISDDSEWMIKAESGDPVRNIRYIYPSGSSFYENLANHLENSLKYIGINVQKVGSDFGSYWNTLHNNTGDFELAFIGWAQDYNDPHNYLYPLLRSGSKYNYARISNSTLDSLIDVGIETTDEIERKARYDEIQKLVIEDLTPYCYVAIDKRSVAYRSDIKGFPLNPLGKVWFYNVYSEKDNVIFIDGDANGPKAQNWTWAEGQDWFGGGSGNWNDPYIIENATIDGYGKYCIMIRDTNAYFIIRNCTLYHSSDHFDPDSLGVVSLINAENGKIFDCNISQSEVSGVYLKNCKNITIEQNLITQHKEYGVRIESSTTNTTIKNCVISDNLGGINLVNSQDLLVLNNTLDNHEKDGICLLNTLDSVITENRINSSSGSGIFFDTCSFIELSKNNVSYSQLRGIQLTQSDNCTLKENMFNFNRFGIGLYYSSDNTIKNNHINETYYGILTDKCGYNLIQENIIYNFSQRGILLLSSLDVLVDHNLFSEGLVGIELRITNNTLISNNSLISLDFGVIIKDGSLNDLTKNLIRGCSEYGIYLYAKLRDCDENDIYNNTFKENYINAFDSVLNTNGINNWNGTLIGNYWDDYQGKDLNDDFIGDTPYSISGIANQEDKIPIWDDGTDIFNPILIDSNWSQTEAEKEWCSGSGTLNDPYIIVNITIDANQKDSGITIVNSKNDYFEIRNCKIINSSGDIYSAGIKLGIDVANGTLIDNNCSNNKGHGIINSGDNLIVNNTITNNARHGIFSNASGTIKGNIIAYNNESGLDLHGHYNVSTNTISWNKVNGILLESSLPFNNITDNQIRNNTQNGILIVSGTNRTVISGNTISRNLITGIFLKGTTQTNISNTYIFENRIYKNSNGVKFNEFTEKNTVWLNAFINSTFLNAIDYSFINSWDNSSFGGDFIGNFWNNYSGPDSDNDGVGDSPFGYQINRTNGINDTAPILFRSMNVKPQEEIKDTVTGISLTFNETEGGSEATVKVEDAPEKGNFEFAGATYNITTTVDMTNNFVIIKIPYDEDSIQYNEEDLKLYHYEESSGWEDITIEVDTVNNIIYGNATSFSSFTAIEPPDSDPPETEISFKGTKFPSGWYNDYPELILESYDGGSGVNITGFSYGDSTWHTKEATSEVNSFKAQFDLNETPYKPTEEEGEITINYNSTDNKGNRESTLTTTIKVDKVAPSSSIDFTGTKYGDIYTSSVTVELSASDGGSGLDYTEYRINDGQWFVYSKSFTLENDGEYSIDVRSYDLVDNQGEITTETITIDRTAPSISSSIIGTQGNDNWYTSEIQITLTAQDDSGTQIFYRKDTYSAWQLYTTPFNLSKEGTNYLYYYAVDQAGNEAVEQSETFYIDTNDPILDVQLSRTPVNDYYLGGVNISLSAEDSNSGVEDGNIEVKINDGQWLPYTEAIELTEDGTYSLSYKVTDNAGNLGEGQKEIKIDSTAPSVDVQINGTVGSNGWYTSYVNVSLTANDDGSGYKSIKYSFNDADYTTYYTPFPIKNEGTTSLYIKLEDKIGNTEKITKSVKIDLSLNDTKIILRGTASTEGWYNDKVNITLNATDDISGVDYVEYSFDKEYWLKYNQSFFYDVEGNNTIYYRYYDMAGNKEVTKSKEIYIDKSSPDTEVSLDGQKSDRGWFITNVVVSFTASDPLSGILKTQYKMNSTDWNEYSAPFTVSQEGNNTVEYRSIDVANNAEEIKIVTFEINKQNIPRGPNPILIGGIIGGIGVVAAVAIVIIRKKLNAGE